MQKALRRMKDRLKATRYDARYQGNVCVRYPFHPFYRSPNLSVRRRFGCHDVEYVELASPRPQRQAVPAWMLDEERCVQMTIGLAPTVDLAALTQAGRLAASAGLVNLPCQQATSGRENFPSQETAP